MNQAELLIQNKRRVHSFGSDQLFIGKVINDYRILGRKYSEGTPLYQRLAFLPGILRAVCGGWEGGGGPGGGE